MSTTITSSTRKPGRPPVTIVWPNGEFTVEQLQTATGLSKVTLYQKVNEALNNQVISIVGKENTKQGRPRTLFKITPVTTATANTTTTPSPAVPVPAPV